MMKNDFEQKKRSAIAILKRMRGENDRDEALSRAIDARFSDDLHYFERTYQALMEMVESPIEERFLQALMSEAPEWDKQIHVLECPEEIQNLSYNTYKNFTEPTLLVRPQLEFKINNSLYRVDFAIATSVLGEPRRVIVECDGHDFHERTKEQAAYDKKRDRDFLAYGYTVLRFTGTEIYKNARECAQEVVKYVASSVRST